MYYHRSPIPTIIKQLKAQRALEMKQHTNAMKQITINYNKDLNTLATLRESDMLADQLLARGVDPVTVDKKMQRNYNRADKILNRYNVVE